jgi:hypothetical protein
MIYNEEDITATFQTLSRSLFANNSAPRRYAACNNDRIVK